MNDPKPSTPLSWSYVPHQTDPKPSTREVIAAAIHLINIYVHGNSPTRDALQALLDGGLEAGDDERLGLVKRGFDLGAEKMRERSVEKAEAMSEHADLNNLSGQCAATLIADEIRDLSLRAPEKKEPG